jgi:hypothetical protein
MKKQLLTLALLGIMVGSFNTLISEPSGSPDGYTGSPSDGSTCFASGCHFASPTAKAGIITSDIPTGGYVPGTTYNLTVTISTGSNRKGFQISPQKADGTLLGTLTAGSGTKVTGGGKYITHSSAKTGTAKWTFKWAAPVKGTGQVDFYGAFAASRNTTYTDVLTVQEKLNVGFTNAQKSEISVYPVPAANQLFISGIASNNYTLDIYNLAGEKVYTLHGQLYNENKGIDVSQLSHGLYIVKVYTAGETQTAKVLIGY